VADEVDINFADLTTYLNTEVVTRDAAIAMTGILTLPASNPTTDNQAARKAYVDAGDATVAASVAAKVAKAGDTMTGQLVLVGDPVAAGDAARKAYVDAEATARAAADTTLTNNLNAEITNRANGDTARVTAPALALNPKIVGASTVGVTNGSGQFTIATGLSTILTAVVCNGDNSAGAGLGTAILVQVEPLATTLTIQCLRNDNSAAVTGTSVRVNWIALGT
jgi:hypothetical protein